MSTHDYVLANQVGSDARVDLNLLFQAIVSQNSSATEPATMYAHMFWNDTSLTPPQIKQRNAANTAWGGVSVAPATSETHATQAGQMIGRNLIVNGSCQVDQVNSGGAVTPSSPIAAVYPVDNIFNFYSSSIYNSKLTFQQVTNKLNSLNAYTSLNVTVATASPPTIAATDYNFLQICIEGLNFLHLRWGTAYAAAVSLQFKVNISVSGTYSGTLTSASGDRSFPFSFTVTGGVDTLVKLENIPGCTDGTWTATNSNIFNIYIDLGCGVDKKGSAAYTWPTNTGSNTWASANYLGATGATNLVSQVNGSTLDIADIQLEKGPFCTTFERKHYDQVLRECQRYLPVFKDTANYALPGMAISSTDAYIAFTFKVETRVPVTGFVSAGATILAAGGNGITCTLASFTYQGAMGAVVRFTVATGLVAGNATLVNLNQCYFTGARL